MFIPIYFEYRTGGMKNQIAQSRPCGMQATSRFGITKT
jgi:hypothetical protein